jgi:hypothetical protein
MQYNYHCNRVVIPNLELVQFWLFLAAFGTPLTRSFPIKKHKTFIYITVITVNNLRYNIIWEIVFPEYFNKKLFLFVDVYLSPDKLARKIYLSGMFYVRVGWVWHGNSTPLVTIVSIVLKLHWGFNGECWISWVWAPSDQTKDYKICICSFSAIKQTALRSSSKGIFAQNQDNTSDWSNMST